MIWYHMLYISLFENYDFADYSRVLIIYFSLFLSVLKFFASSFYFRFQLLIYLWWRFITNVVLNKDG